MNTVTCPLFVLMMKMILFEYKKVLRGNIYILRKDLLAMGFSNINVWKSMYVSFCIIFSLFILKFCYYNLPQENMIYTIVVIILNTLLALVPFFIFYYTFFSQKLKQKQYEKPLGLSLLAALPVSFILQGFMFSDRVFPPITVLKLSLLITQHLYFYQMWGTVFIMLGSLLALNTIFFHYITTNQWHKRYSYIALGIFSAICIFLGSILVW